MLKKKTDKLHRGSVIIDGLNASHLFDITVLQHLLEGGITAINSTIAVWQGLHETMTIIANYFHLFEEQIDSILQVKTTSDIKEAKSTGRVGIILGFQGPAPIENNPHFLSLYYALGIRIVQLTYNHKNLLGSGCMASEDKGLTLLGRNVIDRMNQLGILLDLSHCGHRTTMEAIEASQQPVAFTHANPMTFAAHPRNKFDEALKALAGRGGVVGAATLPAMITEQGTATLKNYIDVIDFLVDTIGIDHVGLGTDFMEALPPKIHAHALKGISIEDRKKLFSSMTLHGFESISKCRIVTDALIERGYTTTEVKKIMGENWLRLYREVWGS